MSTNEELHLGTVFTGRVDSTFQRSMNQLRNIVQGLTSLQRGVANQTSGMARSSKGLNNELTQTNKQLSHVAGGFQKLSAAIKVTASYGLAATFLYGVINGLKQGGKQIVEFDQALKNLQAITGATDAEISVLGSTIKDVATETKYSAVEAAEAAVILGQAGFSAAESTETLNAVANLATGTLSDMSSAADLLTTTIRAFGLEAMDSSKVSDIFAKAVNKSKLTIDKLRTAFNYVGPVAHSAGLSLESTTATAMLLANAGLRASSIGTGLRQVLARLVAPTSKLEVAFKAAGANMDKLNPKTASMEEIITELARVVPSAQKAFELFGLRGASAVSALVESGPAKFREMIKELYDVGAASRMAEKQMEGLGVMSKNLFDRLGRLAIAIGEGGLADAFRTVLVVVRPLISALTYFAESLVGKMTVGILSLTTALTGIGLAFKFVGLQLSAMILKESIAVIQKHIALNGAWAVSLQTLETGFKRLWLVMKSPIGVIGVISAIIVAFMTLKNYLDGTIQRLKEQVIKTEQVVASLENYKKALGEAKVGSDEYSATMKRLIKDFPELEKHIDLTTMKFKDNGKALDEAWNASKAKEIKQIADVIQEYNNKMIQNQANVSSWMTGGGLTGLMPSGRTLSDISKTVGKLNNDNLEKQQAQIEKLGKALLDYGLTTKSMFPEISKVLKEHTDFSEKEIAKYAIAIKKHFNEIEAEKAKIKKAEPVNILNDLKNADPNSSKWADLYQNLGTSGNIKAQGDLRAAVDKMLSDLDRLKEKGKTLNWTPAELTAQLDDARKKAYDNFVKTISDEKVLTEKQLKEQRRSILKRIDDEVAAEKGKISEIKNLRKKDLDNEKMSDADRAKINMYYDDQITKYRKEQSQKLEDLEVEALKVEGKKTEALKLEIAHLKERREELIKTSDLIRKDGSLKGPGWLGTIKGKDGKDMTEYSIGVKMGGKETEIPSLVPGLTKDELDLIRSGKLNDNIIQKAVDHATTLINQGKSPFKEGLYSGAKTTDNPEILNNLQTLNNKITETEKDLEDEITKKKVKALNERLDKTQKYSDEYLNIMEQMYAAHKIKLADLEAYKDQAAKHDLDNIKKEYEQGLATWKKYYAALKKAQGRKVITDEEAREIRVTEKGSFFDRFSLGMQRAKKSWGEFIVELGKQVPDRVADGLTNSIMDFIDGTKSAKDSFSDMARSIIRWLGEIIIKQEILNGMQKAGDSNVWGKIFSSVGSFFGGSGSAGGGGTGVKDLSASVAHTGGVFGKSNFPMRRIGQMFLPEFHKGYNNDEMLAVVRKKETIFTEPQMDELGKRLEAVRATRLFITM